MCRNHGVSDVFSNSAESSLGPSALEDGTSSEESFIKLFFQWLTSSVQIRPRFEKKRGWRSYMVWKNLMWIFQQWCSYLELLSVTEWYHLSLPLHWQTVEPFTVAPKLWRIRCQLSKCQCFLGWVEARLCISTSSWSFFPSAKTVISTVI